MVFNPTSGPATDWLEPTARNSKRLPVKAKGEVRLRIAWILWGIPAERVDTELHQAAETELVTFGR